MFWGRISRTVSVLARGSSSRMRRSRSDTAEAAHSLQAVCIDGWLGTVISRRGAAWRGVAQRRNRVGNFHAEGGQQKNKQTNPSRNIKSKQTTRRWIMHAKWNEMAPSQRLVPAILHNIFITDLPRDKSWRINTLIMEWIVYIWVRATSEVRVHSPLSAFHRCSLMDALCTLLRPDLGTTCLFGCWSHPSAFVPNCSLAQR